MLDRILQLLARVVDFPDQACGQMTTGSDFRSDFIAGDAKAAGRRPVHHDRIVPAVRFCDTSMPPPRWRITVKKLALAVVLAACASPALAGSYVSTWSCKYSRFYAYDNCRTTWTHIPDPVRDPEQERLDAIAFAKENAKWEAFCKPTFRADEYGVRRASYARQGCEFGRSE
jgi:hypothetical protein